ICLCFSDLFFQCTVFSFVCCCFFFWVFLEHIFKIPVKFPIKLVPTFTTKMFFFFVLKMTLTDPLFPAQLVKTAELNPNKNYILGSHPHGIMCFGAFACFSTTSCGFSELFPGLRSSLVVLAGLFKIPLFREYLMGAVSKPSLAHLLSKRGKGNAVVIVVGGAAESLASAPGVNTVVMKQRKGFVRTALEFGADLVPVYTFGENELFQQVIFSEGSLGRRLQDLFKKIMGFAPCLFVGERFGLIPYRRPVTTVVGSPISVPKRITPAQEEVDHYHKLYMEALTDLFHKHKVSYGLSESHELQII
uniref:Acyltransferase n=1 Tax=Oryzias sinensis TaxID=183150 RepID=A0A8C7ZQQ0_9TELE